MNTSTVLEALDFSAWGANSVRLAHVLFILLVAWVAHFVVTRLIRGFRIRIAAHLQDPEQVNRAETLGRVFRYLASVIIAIIAGAMLLSELGVSVGPILGAAGVLGLAVGFGAQSLVKDFVTGFFILLENQIARGDEVDIGGKSGQVEDVTLRYVRLRDGDGSVHYIPNGLIAAVTNRSRSFAYAVVDVGVAYRENVDKALAVMKATADSLCADAVYGPKILDAVDMLGVDRWEGTAVVLRCRFKVRPLEHAKVRREYLRRLSHAFDEGGIDIARPHVTVYTGTEQPPSASPAELVAPEFRATKEATKE